MRRIKKLVTIAVVCALAVAAAATAASSTTVRDQRGDTKALKQKPELDIRRVSVSNESGNRVKYRITMQGALKPGKKFTRPFVLINTRGGDKSRFEYVAVGPRLFQRVGDKYRKVGANKFTSKRKTWIYRFKPERVGLRPGDTYGWAVLTAKGRATDLAPNSRYAKHRFEPTEGSP